MTRIPETQATPLAPLVQRFFTERPPGCQLGAGSNTVASYRDTFRLLLNLTVTQCGKPPTDMDVSDISAGLVGNFLHHFETERDNSAQSRNVRLSAIRSFFNFVAVNQQQVLHHCQRVLQLPAKRHQKTTMTWLDEDETTALLGVPDLTTWYGEDFIVSRFLNCLKTLGVLEEHHPATGHFGPLRRHRRPFPAADRLL